MACHPQQGGCLDLRQKNVGHCDAPVDCNPNEKDTAGWGVGSSRADASRVAVCVVCPVALALRSRAWYSPRVRGLCDPVPRHGPCDRVAVREGVSQGLSTCEMTRGLGGASHRASTPVTHPPLGHPIAAIPRSALGTGLEVDRALPAAARLLAVAALLLGLDARDGAATEALRSAVRGTSASGGSGAGRDTEPHMSLDMANHLHYWCGAWLQAGDRPWV